MVGKNLAWKRTDQPRKVPDNGSFPSEYAGKDWFYYWQFDNPVTVEENTGIWIIDY